MPTDNGINEKVLIHEVKITNLENGMKEVKTDIKNLNDVYRTIDLLTNKLNILTDNVKTLSDETSKNIKDVSELIRIQSLEFKENQKKNDENFKKHEEIISEIKNKPAYEALSQKQWLGKQLAQKLIVFLLALVVLGWSFYTYNQNQKLHEQIITITNQK